jgi:hypothetical protein
VTAEKRPRVIPHCPVAWPQKRSTRPSMSTPHPADPGADGGREEISTYRGAAAAPAQARASRDPLALGQTRSPRPESASRTSGYTRSSASASVSSVSVESPLVKRVVLPRAPLHVSTAALRPREQRAARRPACRRPLVSSASGSLDPSSCWSSIRSSHARLARRSQPLDESSGWRQDRAPRRRPGAAGRVAAASRSLHRCR